MVAISSRSADESERVARLRMVLTKRSSAATASGSALGPTDKPLVRERLAGLSAWRICPAVTSSPAAAGLTPTEKAGPIVTIARIAARFLLPYIFDIVSP